MPEIPSSDLVLLTGAGFTKNFGGFLGAEIWALIFNHPLTASSPDLKKRLAGNFNYESIYSEVLEDENAKGEDKDIIKTVVKEAYRTLDDQIKNWVFNADSPYPVNWYGLQELFSLFRGDAQHKGFFFTLNQDLFMERRSGMACPGVPRFLDTFYNMRGTNIDDNQFVTLPTGEGVNDLVHQGIQNHAGQAYIKLHGSFGWNSALGSSPMVVGTNKTVLIDNEPLLRAYSDLFESVLKSGNKRLLVIGYGFMDKHINEIIHDAARNHGLQLYIMTTTPPADFTAGKSVYEGHRLWDSVAGYFPYKLVDIFPGNQEQTPLIAQIRESLLRQ
jgi:hypothetical protein